MKKNRFSTMAVLAILFAASSAFATKMDAEKEAKQAASYYWLNTSNVYQMQNTEAAEKTRTGCSSTHAVCENGYTGDQFNTPDVPSSGLVAGATPAKTIRRSTN